jgi:hypothetical protein
MSTTTSTADRPPAPSCSADCIAAVLRSAETRPLAWRHPQYSAALADLGLELADCIGWLPDQYDGAWRDVLAVWQNRHIDAAIGGQR